MRWGMGLGRVTAIAWLLAAGDVAGQAVPPAGTDPQATIDALQKQIDELKRQVQQQRTATPPAPPLPAGCFRGGDGKNYCGGWIVEVGDHSDKSVAEMSVVGRFVADNPARLSMRDHRETVPFTAERLGYRGGALLNVTTPGAYAFSVEAEYPKHDFLIGTRCSVAMTLEDDPLLKLDFASGENRAQAKSVKLAAGLWRLGFDWRCEFNWHSVKPEVAPPRLVFRLLPPGEFQPRHFRLDELLHERG